MGTDRDGLDSILAGNEEGAKGCCLSVDMTSDGIAVLSSDGYVLAPNGGAVAVCDHTYTELRQVAPRLLPVGQALDLARACRSKIAITLRDPSLLPQMRMTLRQTDYLDDAVFVGLGLVEAARIASANPDLHIMGEMPAVPDNIAALVNASQTTGLFGLRAAPAHLTPPLLRACRAAGLRTPQTVTLCPADALPPLPFGWPVIAKPADQAAYARCDFPGRRKVYLVQDAARLRELLAAAAQGGYFGSWLVQEYIPGPDTRLGVVNAYCAADGSVPWLVQGQPLLQERTPEGTGNYAAVLVEPSRQDAALLDALRGLLQAAGWHGFANFDLKYDRRGEPVLFELNPRQGRASYFCDAADAPLAVPPVQDLLYGGPVTPPTLRPAVWYTAPWYAVRRACPNRLALRRAGILRRRGRATTHLLAAGEGASRRIWFAARQAGYCRKL